MSAEQTMSRHPAGRHARHMDEATIDCACGSDAAFDLQWQFLDDGANWRTVKSISACFSCAVMHLDHGLTSLHQADRYVVTAR